MQCRWNIWVSFNAMKDKDRGQVRLSPFTGARQARREIGEGFNWLVGVPLRRSLQIDCNHAQSSAKKKLQTKLCSVTDCVMGADNRSTTSDNQFLRRKERTSTVDFRWDCGAHKFVNFTTRCFRPKERESISCQFLRSEKHDAFGSKKKQATVTQHKKRNQR